MKPELQIAFIGGWFLLAWMAGFILGNRKMDETLWMWLAIVFSFFTLVISLSTMIGGISDFIKHLNYTP